MTDDDLNTVPGWRGKQSLAARIAEILRKPLSEGYSIRRVEAKRLAGLERVANFDKKITEEEIRVRLRAGEW